MPSLKRELRFIVVVNIAAGAMISSGLFILTGLASLFSLVLISAFVHIAQDVNFEKKRLKAKNKALRDIVLLGVRRRLIRG